MIANWVTLQSGGYQPGGPGTCPFNSNHDYPVPVSDQFLYNGAKGGGPGKGEGRYLVPAPGDTDHQFIAPKGQDIPGPCPGLNAAANCDLLDGFIARDGITNYTELTGAIQNMYNVGYDLANFLATISIIVADGDLITTKVSIGCDATTRTSSDPTLTSSEPGLDGHNKFEGDVSLTRNDYVLGKGDNFNFNGTLFDMMAETAGGTFDLDGLADYRYQRYIQSRQENPEMFFGPLANWTSRVTPYSLLDVSAQIGEMYLKHPVGFGGNAGGAFVGLGFPPYIIGGNLMAATPSDYACLLYQLVSGPIPSSLNGVIMPTVEALEFVLTVIGGEAFTNLGCAVPLTK
ncbi:Cloroperoxidase [Hyaloscypha variabilis F]|uniref:Cloroperoxidase n=1 Tax=Hyaloscypha variabilis (strain UAMH 11265 / GT02V1 / F) TaxID=1149755 RepID=A0A2J6RWG0_HYAVF|nr:Cloroperoxidase [Hyaloscypha variabilis F]